MLRLYRRSEMAMAVLVLGMAADASAQQLLETDGVELLGEAQLAIPNGGTCNVLESDTAYEPRRENDGAPMDIWRLDFSVRNGSGRWLDHLISRFQIESEWPECTNWDRVSSAEIANVAWSDSIDSIQRSGRNVVGPNETLTQIKYFIVLQGDPPPRFSNWSVDFDFAATPLPAGTAADTPAATTAAQQPAATAEQENLFRQSIADSVNPAMFEAYLAQFPNGVFRLLAEARLAELRAPAGDAPGAGGPRGGGAGTPPAGAARTRDAAPAPGVDVCSAGPVQLALTPLGLDPGRRVRGLGV